MLFDQVLHIFLTNGVLRLLANALEHLQHFGFVHWVAAPDFVDHPNLHAKLVVFLSSEFQDIYDRVTNLNELVYFKFHLSLCQTRSL